MILITESSFLSIEMLSSRYVMGHAIEPGRTMRRPPGAQEEAIMLERAADGLRGGEDNQREHSFTPDVVWSLVGGIVVLAVCLVLYTLIVTWGGWQVGVAMPGGGAAPISRYFRELAGLSLAGFLVVFVARGIGLRTRPVTRVA